MLQRDYILEIIHRFVEALSRWLVRAATQASPEAIYQVEEAIGQLLDLDGATALALDASSLVTMMELSGIADSTASYACYALMRVAEAYDASGKPGLAAVRREQAQAVAQAFLCDLDAVPEELQELDAAIAAERADG